METKASESLLAALVLAACAASAPAEIVRIGLTAEVTSVEDSHGLLEGRINVGDVVTGCYTYESETPDIYPAETRHGQYEFSGASCGVRLNTGGLIFQTDPASMIFYILLGNDLGADLYYLYTSSPVAIGNGADTFSVMWRLLDFSCTALSSDALPTTPPVLEDWPNTWSKFWVGGYAGIRGEDHFSIGCTVTSVYLIPEPATFSQLLLGGLLTFRRRS